jgi:hypothetical protein
LRVWGRALPPTFALLVPLSLEVRGGNPLSVESLRTVFALPGTPIGILQREGNNPYEPKGRNAPERRG